MVHLPGFQIEKALAQALVVDRQPAHRWRDVPSGSEPCPAMLEFGVGHETFLMHNGIWMRVRGRMLTGGGGGQATPRGVTRTDRQLGGGNVCPVLGFCDLLLHGKPGPSPTLFLHMGGVPTARGNQGVCARRSACGCITETKTAQQGARRRGMSCHFSPGSRDGAASGGGRVPGPCWLVRLPRWLI